MLAFAEMDKHVTIYDQLKDGGGPVALVNLLTVDPKEADQLLAAWAEDAAYMKRQPGFISTQLHRGIAGSGTGESAIAPRTCQRALVRPRSSTSASPAASREPLSRKTSRIRSVTASRPASPDGFMAALISSERQYYANLTVCCQ